MEADPAAPGLGRLCRGRAWRGHCHLQGGGCRFWEGLGRTGGTCTILCRCCETCPDPFRSWGCQCKELGAKFWLLCKHKIHFNGTWLNFHRDIPHQRASSAGAWALRGLKGSGLTIWCMVLAFVLSPPLLPAGLGWDWIRLCPLQQSRCQHRAPGWFFGGGTRLCWMQPLQTAVPILLLGEEPAAPVPAGRISSSP